MACTSQSDRLIGESLDFPSSDHHTYRSGGVYKVGKELDVVNVLTLRGKVITIFPKLVS